MAMNFNALVAEAKDRGFDHVSDTRMGRYINQSYKGICGRAPFPFLETFALGTAPLTIADLRAVLSVRVGATDTPLRWIDRRNLIQRGYDTATTGSARYWYQTSRTEVRVYPANTSDNLTVYYIKVPATLTGTDAHLIPDEFEDLIIDGAVIKAYKDGDELDRAAALSGYYEEQLRKMIDALVSRNHDSYEYTRQTAETYETGGWGPSGVPTK